MILGVDFSTHAVDLVLLSEDDDTAEHHRVHLDGPGKLLDRVRRVRDVMPARGAWEDLGVTLIGIEEPFFRPAERVLPLQFVLGGLMQCLPRSIPVALIRSDDWRTVCGLPARAARDQHKRNAVTFALERWTNAADRIDDNAADAYGIAWATRELDRRREVRPAA